MLKCLESERSRVQVSPEAWYWKQGDLKMELVLHIEGANYAKLKEKLLTDETVNRASIVFKDAKQFGKEGGYLCIVSGTDERCKKALELAKDEGGSDLAKEVSGDEKEKILKQIKEEENKAIEGFGNILG
jgi:hypothetical protein